MEDENAIAELRTVRGLVSLERELSRPERSARACIDEHDQEDV